MTNLIQDPKETEFFLQYRAFCARIKNELDKINSNTTSRQLRWIRRSVDENMINFISFVELRSRQEKKHGTESSN